MTEPQSRERSAGVLAHPTSLPGPHGIGQIGVHARRFARVANDMGLSWWQMLPIGPTGYGDSPYQSPSTFAGNPMMIDIDDLVNDGLVDLQGLDPEPGRPDSVEFGAVIPRQMELLADAAAHFQQRATSARKAEFDHFVDQHGATWLTDFALFTAIKRAHHLRPWWEWDNDLALREPLALRRATRELAAGIHGVLVEQFLFDRQFRQLRTAAIDSGVELIGDIPIFVAHDSADVWANRHLFFLDDRGLPTVVAGVPPDYFSATGQRWGNPLYDWDVHRADGFAWWKSRMGRMLDLFSLVRIDHFRGFAASWHIPVEERTAMVGEWVPGPGPELFDSLVAEFGEMPVIAEDLGLITPDVEDLRDRYGFPGMKVLQFGFGAESAHALEEYRENVIAYTGTHDNDTAVGWWLDDSKNRIAEHEMAKKVLDTDGTEIHWDLIRAVFESIASIAVVPLQDILGLDSSARMNTPAIEAGNWRWRFSWSDLDRSTITRLRRLATATRRTGR